MKPPSSAVKSAGRIAVGVFLAVVFSLNTLQNLAHEDYRNSNFAKFWIAGHMVLTGLNPYDPAQWHAEHIRLGATSVPDRIFLYPLPQAFFLAPLALLPPQVAFVVWSLLSQVLIALACLILLNMLSRSRQGWLFFPLVISLLFFGPIYLTLQVGSIGAIAMVVVLGSILLLNRHKTLLAALLLSLLILKPPQGLPILFLGGFWLLLKRDWKAIAGLVAGGLALLVAGLLLDPLWVQEFLSNSQAVSSRSMGLQSNVWSMAYLACRGAGSCTLALGGLLFLGLLAFGGWLIWRYDARLAPWELFNLIIPLAFISAFYVFGYDQILYIFPIVWIAGNLLERTRSYVPVFLFLIVLDVVSFVALLIQARTHSDLWSVITTLLVFGLNLWLFSSRKPSPTSEPTVD